MIALETMRDRFVTVVGELLDKDPRAVVVLADIGVARFAEEGVIERHPDRVVNVGIREQAMVGVAAGMALEGFRPIVHTYAPFMVERAFEQIKLDFCHQGVGAVLVSVGASHDWAKGGRTHHAPADVALVSTLPGWKIHVPGHADEAELALRQAMSVDKPVYIRLSEASNATAHVEAVEGTVVVRSGSAESATVIAIGPMLDRVVQATADRDVTVLYAATAVPLAGEALRRCRSEDIVIVEPTLEGTSVPLLAELLRDRPRRLLGIGVGRVELRRYGSADEHDAAHGLDVAGLRRRIDVFLRS